MRFPSLGPLVVGSAYTLSVYILRLLTQLALLLLLARWLGPSEYGQFAGIAAMAMAMGTLAAFGLGFVVLAETSKDQNDGNQLLAISIAACVLSFVILFPLYFCLVSIILNSTFSHVSVTLIGVSELLVAPIILLIGYRLHGSGMVALSQSLAIWPITARLIGLGLGILLIPSASIDAYAYIHFSGTLIALCIVFRIAQRKVTLPTRLHWVNLKTISVGLRYAIMNFTAMLPSELDKVLALRYLGSVDAGLYALASRGIGFVALPVTAMLQAALPRLIQDIHQLKPEWQPLLKKILLVAFVYGVTTALLIFTVAPTILIWALGDAFHNFASVVRSISIICPFISVRIATGAALFALGRPTTRTAIEGSAILLTVVTAPFLIAEFGLFGLILAAFAGELAMSIVGILILALHMRTR